MKPAPPVKHACDLLLGKQLCQIAASLRPSKWKERPSAALLDATVALEYQTSQIRKHLPLKVEAKPLCFGKNACSNYTF